MEKELVITGEKNVIGPGKQEIISELMCQREKLIAELRRQQLESKKLKQDKEIRACLEKFSDKFFGREIWHTLDSAKKEALCEIAVRDSKRWLLKHLLLIFSLNAAVISAGIFLHPVFSLFSLINFAWWPIFCPGNPCELGSRFKIVFLREQQRKKLFSESAQNLEEARK